MSEIPADHWLNNLSTKPDPELTLFDRMTGNIYQIRSGRTRFNV
jgi:hypothetical protein